MSKTKGLLHQGGERALKRNSLCRTVPFHAGSIVFINHKNINTGILLSLCPYKEPGRFPGGGPPIGKGNERPQRPPAGPVEVTFYTFVKNNAALGIGYTRLKTPG
jgi:hypothetical protein